MLSNRSVPLAQLFRRFHIRMSASRDWLCKAFGFTVRLRIANHRIQLKAAGEIQCIVLALAAGTGSKDTSFWWVDRS